MSNGKRYEDLSWSESRTEVVSDERAARLFIKNIPSKELPASEVFEIMIGLIW